MYLYIITFVVGLTVGVVVQDWRNDSKELGRVAAENAIKEDNQKNVHKSAAELEKDKLAIDKAKENDTKAIVKLVDRPVYLNYCLDAEGVSLINGADK